MVRTLFFLAALTLVSPLLAAKEIRKLDAKAEALSYLREMRNTNVKRLKEIDDALRTRIEEGPASTLEVEVNRLRVAKREHTLRQEFLDRLILKVDTKFVGGDLRSFFERALTEMAKVDAMSEADTTLWKFMKFASEALHHLPEKKENVLVFLDGYMNRSVADPIRPEDFLKSRNYSNGRESESGHPLEREQVGDLADSRLKSLTEEKTEEKSSQTAIPPAN